jgi:hypothetical protein
MSPRHTTAMDGGSVDIAGANYRPVLPVHKKGRQMAAFQAGLYRAYFINIPSQIVLWPQSASS